MATGGKFGCGDFLPGYGPDDFQDYNPPIDQIDEPDDPPGGGGGISIDPVDGSVIDIPPSPGPGDDGGGGGGGDDRDGPSTPGPQGPAAPGPSPGGPTTPGPPGPAAPGRSGEVEGPVACKCVIARIETKNIISTNAFDKYEVTFYQTCKKVPLDDNSAQTTIDEYIKNAKDVQGAIFDTANNPAPGGGCATVNGQTISCNGTCPFIRYTFTILKDVQIGPQPGEGFPGTPPPGGGGGGGGGPSTPGPQGPAAPGPSPGPGGGGGGGGGGPSTPGPQGPAPPIISTAGGGGGGGGGPSTPGPQGPAPPGGPTGGKKCKCMVINSDTLPNPKLLGVLANGGQQYEVCWKRECKKVDPKDANTIPTIEKWVKYLTGQGYKVTGSTGGSENCAIELEGFVTCGGNCTNLCIRYSTSPTEFTVPDSPVIEIDTGGPEGPGDFSTELGGSVFNPGGGGVTGEGPVVLEGGLGGVTFGGPGDVIVGDPGVTANRAVTSDNALVDFFDPTAGQDDDTVVSTSTGLGKSTTPGFFDPRDRGDGLDATSIDTTLAEAGVTTVDTFGDPTLGVFGTGDAISIATTAINDDLVPDDGLDIESAEELGELLEANQTENFTIDLNSPLVSRFFAQNAPTGFIDPDIALTPSTRQKRFISRGRLRSDIFASLVHESIHYIGTFVNRFQNWDSTAIFDLTIDNIIRSLNGEFLTLCRSIKKRNGSFLSDQEIAQMIRNRLVDGSISDISLERLRLIQRDSLKFKAPTFRPSKDLGVNEAAAYAYMEKVGIPLDTAKLPGKSKYIIQNWKTLATDLAKYIPITVDGETKKYYIKDTDEFIDRSTLKLSDGDYFDVNVDGGTYRLFAESEKDHAFILGIEERQTVLNLLGSDGLCRVTASSLASDEVEFNYSLSTPRQNLYVLSCNLTNIDTVPVQKNSLKSQLLKTTTIKFDLVDISDETTLNEFNEYIKYKVNGKTLLIDDEDRILDHLEQAGSLTYIQDDILFDVAKSTKTIPLFTRQIPWYIIIYPTNRFEYNYRKIKSRILSYDPSGAVVREIAFRPTINNELSKNIAQMIDNDFAGLGGTDVFGRYSSLARNVKITPTKRIFREGYRQNNALRSAQEFEPSRKKSGFRVAKEIITEIANNYLLDDEGLGVGVNTFDVFSRMTLEEYQRFLVEDSSRLILPQLKNGLIEDVKLYNPIIRAGTNAPKKTRLVQRKEGAPADTFTQIKYTRDNKVVNPPGTTFNSSEIVDPPPTRPTR